MAAEPGANSRARRPVQPLCLEGLRAEPSDLRDITYDGPYSIGSCGHVDGYRIVHVPTIGGQCYRSVRRRTTVECHASMDR